MRNQADLVLKQVLTYRVKKIISDIIVLLVNY